MRFVPRSSYGRPMLWEDGGPNRNFLTYVLCDQGFTMQVLKDVGLLQNKVQWNTCGQDMTWSAESTIPEQYTWRCPKKVAGFKCSESRSIKQGSWFQQSSHLPRNFTHQVSHCAPRTCPPYPKRMRGLCFTSASTSGTGSFMSSAIGRFPLFFTLCPLFYVNRANVLSSISTVLLGPTFST